MCYNNNESENGGRKMKIAVCDDDKLLTGEIDRQLQGLRQRMGISF